MGIFKFSDKGGNNDLGQIVAAVFRRDKTNIKVDCLVNKLALAGAVVCFVPLAHLLQSGFFNPECEFPFSFLLRSFFRHKSQNTSSFGYDPQSDPREFIGALRKLGFRDPQVDPNPSQPTHSPEIRKPIAGRALPGPVRLL